MNLQHPGRRRGFTLLETVLVIAAGLGLLIGGIIFYRQSALNAEQAGRTRAAVALSAAVRELQRNTPDYATLTTTSVREAASLPESMFDHVVITSQPGLVRFRISFRYLGPTLCARLEANPDDLGTGVVSATCIPDYGTTLAIIYRRR